MARSPDTRFCVIEDAAALLAMLPAAPEIQWPADPGDQEAVDEALRFISGWLPAAKASRRAHKAMLRGRQLRAVQGANPR